jgi:tRNA(Ile)-lysidine synthase
MRQEVAREVLPVVDVEDGRVSIGRKAFRAWHPALQRRAILWAVGQIGSVEDVTYLNVVAAAGVGLRGRVGAVAELSGAMRLRVDYDALVIELNTTTLPESDILLNDAPVIPVVAPGVTKIPGRNWQLCVEAEPSERSQARLVIPDGSTLLLRTRRAGDRFAPLGLGGHTQRLSEWMVDHKVPRHLRPRVPLLVINGEIAVILYGVQWTIGQHFAVGDDATPVCFIRTDGCIV